MNVYLLTQNKVTGYDTYDSMVVVAATEEAARKMDPRGGNVFTNDWICEAWPNNSDDVVCLFVGVADDSMSSGVLCASFNAG